MRMENRFKMLTKIKPDTAQSIFKKAAENSATRQRLYEYLAQGKVTAEELVAVAAKGN
jgi:hypothetical protein